MSTVAHQHSDKLRQSSKNRVYVDKDGNVSYPTPLTPPEQRKNYTKKMSPTGKKTGGRKRKSKSRRKYKKTYRKRKY